MSTVTGLDFRDALFNAFADFWAGRTQIAAPNVEFDPDLIPDDEDAWVRLFILGEPQGQTPLSSSTSRAHFSRQGVLTVEVYVRQNTELDQGYTLAEAVIEFLEKNGRIPDAFFSELSPPQEIGPDGTWFQVTVSASWVYWTDRAA